MNLEFRKGKQPFLIKISEIEKTIKLEFPLLIT